MRQGGGLSLGDKVWQSNFLFWTKLSWEASEVGATLVAGSKRLSVEVLAKLKIAESILQRLRP